MAGRDTRQGRSLAFAIVSGASGRKPPSGVISSTSNSPIRCNWAATIRLSVSSGDSETEPAS